MRQTPLVLLAAAALVLSCSAPALAEPALLLSDVKVHAAGRSLDLTVTTQGLAAAAGLDPASVTASVDGRNVPTASVEPAASEHVAPPRVLLLVDTTGSMAGQPMIEAKQAVSTFVAQAPVDVPVGLMSYASTPRMLVAPTVDRSPVLGAVTGLEAQGQTALYDAVQAGVLALGGHGDRRIVLLSDGEDNRSQATLQQVLAATRSSGVTLDAVGFRTGKSVQAVLQQLADSGRGRVHSASSAAELSAALATSVRSRATALDVRLLVPEGLSGENTMTITASTPQGPLTATTPVRLGDVPVAVPDRSSWWGTRNALLVGLGAISASLVIASLALAGGGRRQKNRTRSVLDRYTTSPQPAKEDLRTASPVARTALELADRVVTKRKLADKSTLRLARAAVAFNPAEWLLLQASISFGLTLLLVLFGQHPLVAVAVGTVLGVFGPRLYLFMRARRRQKAFADQLPDALQMAAGSLSSGYSLAQALDGLVQEGSEPMATEVGKALAESRLGVPVEKTLDGVADRMDSKDFSWVVMAIRVQREVGGNLGGVLTTVSATMRERAALRRHVRGLSAEGRLSAYILIGLPISLFLFMFTSRREYLEPMYTTGLGVVLIVAALVLMSIGSFVMSRMVKVEV